MTEKTWYKPGEITYSTYQLKNFLLPNFLLLKGGDYPKQTTGYLESEYISNAPPGEDSNALDIAIELGIRLDLIGEQSGLLIDLYMENGLSEAEDKGDMFLMYKIYKDVAKLWHLDEERVIKRSKSMLRFMCGVRTPEVDYQKWQTNGHIKYPAADAINTILEYAFP